MDTLKIDLRACDVGVIADAPEDIVKSVVMQTVEVGWGHGADVVVFPEYFWMCLEQFVGGEDKLRGVSELFWQKLWPELLLALSREDKAVVLGTVPCVMSDGSIRNRSPILCDGHVHFQDKVSLTPWESQFSPGDTLHVWTLRGARFVVMVCLDIEVPELAALLRGKKVDAILVPSATESINGLERIGRCASARSVELCCHVGVAHLLGKADSELVDKNVGRAAWFTPSQAAFEECGKVETTNTAWCGYERLNGDLDLDRLAACRADRSETNPAHLTLHPVRCEIASRETTPQHP